MSVDQSTATPLLSAEGLRVIINGNLASSFSPLQGVDLRVEAGEFVGLVGESGSGKSTLALALTRLHSVRPPQWASFEGRVDFKGIPMFELDDEELRALRGREISYVFQSPSDALSPTHRVGNQVVAVLRTHSNMSRKAAHERAVALLDGVGIDNPEARSRDYPHQFSGGMRQRAVIAMAIALGPSLLIADEPTSALDVLTEDRILELLHQLRRESGTAIVLVSHNLPLVLKHTDRVVVMYGGSIVEQGFTEDVLKSPQHWYTQGLLSSLPTLNRPWNRESRLPAMKTLTGNPQNVPGCQFSPRCQAASPLCDEERPNLTLHRRHCWACHHPIGPSRDG